MIFELGILAVGLVAGVLSGLFGIGGGIVMVPVLIAFFGLDMLDANAASLAAMLLPVGFLGVINYYKAGYIKVRESLWIACGLFVGSFLGAKIALSIDINSLSKLYAGFLLYVALQFLLPDLFRNKAGKPASNIKHASWQMLLMGVFAGVIAGMFGKGGGIIIVPILIKIFKYDQRAATATSLAALQLPVGLPSVIEYAQSGHFNLTFAVLLAFGLVTGTFFGSKWALKLSAAIFKKIYAVFLLGVAVYMVVHFL
ncbi:MAG: sulfite exporter TauE/SafE family protein [Candidatus Azobacteroides sp.]|nr:sulfite exporter TauE/SafE family protein [Candidatus Azobacteroides sp.]